MRVLPEMIAVAIDESGCVTIVKGGVPPEIVAVLVLETVVETEEGETTSGVSLPTVILRLIAVPIES